jgi:hypothetical protein
LVSIYAHEAEPQLNGPEKLKELALAKLLDLEVAQRHPIACNPTNASVAGLGRLSLSRALSLHYSKLRAGLQRRTMAT